MIAETLALALVLASPGSPPPRAAPALQPDNATRARRGLLPRKAARMATPSRAGRIVLRTPAPTWLGEPGEAGGAAAAVALEPAAGGPVPVPALAMEAPALRASAEAVLVEVSLTRRSAEAPAAALRATVAAPQLEVLVRRRVGG